jgi:hypothetical protein
MNPQPANDPQMTAMRVNPQTTRKQPAMRVNPQTRKRPYIYRAARAG